MTTTTGQSTDSQAGRGPAPPIESGPDPAGVYALGADQQEAARLWRQSGELRPEAEALLARIGLRPGDAALDVGCGPRGILDLLAARCRRADGWSAWTPTQATSRRLRAIRDPDRATSR